MYSKSKFELSRKMKLGVGRAHTPGHFLKIGSFGFLGIAFILGINAINLYNHRAPIESLEGQVLGATDLVQSTSATTNSQFIEYKVKKGETLFSIAQQFNHSWTTLATLNDLEAPFSLKPGQSLKIPND
jgi:hypothetical protein